MDKLTECRMKIDEIDSQIIELFEARMDVVKEVTSYKINNNKPVLDSSREAIMLDKNLKKIKNEEYKKYYGYVLEGYLKASKEMQQNQIDNLKK